MHSSVWLSELNNKTLTFFILGRLGQDQVAAQVGILIVGADCHFSVNDLPACYPASAVFLIAQVLAFKELNVVVVNGHCMTLMFCTQKVEWGI